MSILLILIIIGLFFAVHLGKLAISRILTVCLIVGIIIYIIISDSLLGVLDIVIAVGLLGLVFPSVFSIIGDLFHFLISILNGSYGSSSNYDNYNDDTFNDDFDSYNSDDDGFDDHSDYDISTSSNVDCSGSDYDEHEGFKNPCIGTITDKHGNEHYLYEFEYYKNGNKPEYYRDKYRNIHYVN